MRKLVFAAAAACATLTATAAVARPADGEQRFVHDGDTYVYTSRATPNGRQLIQGRRLNDGRRFRLLVNGDRVSGESDGVPVDFRASEARGAAAGAVMIEQTAAN